MFGWLKSKKENLDKSNIINASTSSKAVDFTSEIKKVVDMSLHGNAKPSLLYAKAAGYKGDVIDYDDISSFLECLRVSHHDLNGLAAAAAKYWIEDDLDLAIHDEFWEFFFFSSFDILSADESNENKDGYKEIKALRNTLKGKSLGTLWRSEDQKIGDYALSRAIELKLSDLDKIFAKLDERKSSLKPLLARALSSGKNKYGEAEYDKYFKEINDFFDYFFPDGELDFYNNIRPLMEVAQYIDRWFSDGLIDTAIIPENGIDFEYWCAEMLEGQGWQAIVSKASGDQGVDIEARKGGFVVAVQCKRYSSPVGNKAVQEVFAGMANISADAAVVISTAGFTKSAIEIAHKTNVILIDADQITEFTSLLGFDGVALNDADTTSLNDNVEISLKSPAAKHLGKCFTMTIDKFETDAVPNLSEKINKGIDANTGAGDLSLEPTELFFLLSFSELILTSEIKLTTTDRNFDEVIRDGDTTSFKNKLGVTDEALEKLNSIGDKGYLYFYELLDVSERLELRDIIKSFYEKMPSDIIKNVALPDKFISLSDAELGA